MNEHPNAAIVRSAYEAVERGDMETFASALDDEHLVARVDAWVRG